MRAHVTCSLSRAHHAPCLCWETGLTRLPSPPVPSHTVNLLGNLPLKCLDVLLTLEPREGSLEFLGVNMDVIRVLLSFLEKRLNQVGRGTCGGGCPGALAFPSSCGHCLCDGHTGQWRSAQCCDSSDSSSHRVVQPSPSSLSSTWTVLHTPEGCTFGGYCKESSVQSQAMSLFSGSVVLS